MEKYLCDKFQLTETGAKGLAKAVYSSFSYYAVYMLPIMLIMFFLQSVMNGTTLGISTSVVAIILIATVLYVVTSINYETTYNETYKESANLRIEIADLLKEFPLAYFSKHDISDLSQTIMSDVASIEHALSHAIGSFIGFIGFFIVISIMMLVGDYQLGLCVIIPLFLSGGILYVTKKRQIQVRGIHYKKLRDISENFQSAIEMSQEIKSYGLKEKTVRDIKKELEESERFQLKAEIEQALPISIAKWSAKLSIGLVSVMGLSLFIQGQTSLLYLVGYIIAATKLSESVEGIYMYLGEIFYLDAKIKNIKALRSVEPQTGEKVQFTNYDIVLENVKFSYTNKGKPIINGASFVAKQNQVTALIGPSGCGKSTLLRLMSRLYDYDEGKITIGGYDIKNVDTACLFEKISVVFQDVTLFNTSILENIRIGRLSASDEEVLQAAKLAGCQDIIDRLPQGIHTLVGENGAKLSGGERQRISIARAMLKDAPIILLDEITSSLDVENESLIQKGLNRLLENKTVIIISHRLQSIRNVNQIVLLQEGKVISAGTHEELYEKAELYRELLRKSQLTENFSY